MAGAPIGGAEAFFECATITLHHAGDKSLPLIRRDPECAARLRAAGLQVVELAFGDALDFLTKPRMRRASQKIKPEIVTPWMLGYLYLAGAGPEEADLRALASELGIIDRASFLGWRRDVGALLAATDIFIYSSRHEPFGNIVLETWSAAKPVIAAAAQGPSELIIGAISKVPRPQAMFSKPFPSSDDRKTHGETRRIAAGSSYRNLEHQ